MHGLETAVGGMTDVFIHFTGKNKTKKLGIEYAISQL